MSWFNWFWNKEEKFADCVSCDKKLPKEAMKEIWFSYTEENGKTGTSSVFVCEQCMKEVAETTESLMAELEVFDDDDSEPV